MPELLGRGALVERESLSTTPPVASRSCSRNPSPLEAIGEVNVQRLRAVERLLHAGTDGVVVSLGLDHCEGDVGVVEKDVIGLNGFPREASRCPS